MTIRIALLGAVAAGAGVWLFTARHAPAPSSAALAASRHAPYDSAALPGAIACFEERARKNDSFLDWSFLAGLYLRRCRAAGDDADAVRAEKAANRAILLSHGRWKSAQIARVQSLSAQHRFRDALSAARNTLRQFPNSPQAARLYAECLFEMGEYDRSTAALRTLPPEPEDPGALAFRARIAHVNGQPEQALELYRRACSLADGLFDLPHESASWFHDRLGDQLMAMGRPAEARAAYADSLSIFPRGYKAMLGMARAAAGERKWGECAKRALESEAILPVPEAVGLAAEAFTALGRTREAKQQMELLEAIWKLERAAGHTLDRGRALVLADHGRSLQEAARLARGELAMRKDIYTWDAAAWTSYRAGRRTEAKAFMVRALARGTKDALLERHARAILGTGARRPEEP